METIDSLREINHSQGTLAPQGMLKHSILRIYTFRENQEDCPPRLAFGVYIRQMEGLEHLPKTFPLAYIYQITHLR